MAYPGILDCFGRNDKWFMGVTVTDGAGSPRDDLYANYTDEQMKQVRHIEQIKAAFVGEYGAQAFLEFASSEVKDPTNRQVVEDIKQVIGAARPSVLYTHNLADKHDTHVAVAVRTLTALRELPADVRPNAVYGCEIWRNLDWLLDTDKVVFDVAAHENIAAAVLGVHDSQICGGKRYDLATLGRRRANATYYASHGTDSSTGLIFGMDLTPLVNDPSMDIKGYIDQYIQRLSQDVSSRISKMLG
jgi:LmbE family N-acetylglucosaminyl deacetylase